MGKVDWENNLKGLEIDEAYNRFLYFDEQIWNEYVPFKRNSYKRKDRVRMSEEIQSMIKHNYGTKLDRKRTKLNIAVKVKNSQSH